MSKRLRALIISAAVLGVAVIAVNVVLFLL